MKKALITIAVSLVAIRVFAKSKSMNKLSPIKVNQKLRECDPLGCGYFGAPRGSRTHKGIDIITVKGEPIQSPISGEVKRYAYPYANDSSYKGIVIQNKDYYVKMFYLEPTIEIGEFVIEGDVIGLSQDISAKHGSAMQNHVHVEIYRNGSLIDPTRLFF